MSNFKHLYGPALVLFLLLPVLAKTASAQSNIFNTPSTDILAEGTVGIRFIAKFKPNDEDAKKKFLSFTQRVIYGLTKNVEIGLNVIGHIQPGPDTTTIVPTVKWRFFTSEKRKIAVVAGDSVYIPLRNRKYELGNYFYITGSKEIGPAGPKLTVGTFYYTRNVVAKNAARVGGQFGLEQKVSKRVGFAAEWLTGRHANGNLTAGFKFKINKRVTSLLGYTIGNDRAIRGNHFFYSAVGINFN